MQFRIFACEILFQEKTRWVEFPAYEEAQMFVFKNRHRFPEIKVYDETGLIEHHQPRVETVLLN